MKRRAMSSWMWAETVDMLDQAERLQRQFFRLAAQPAGASRQPRWEPPVDVYAGSEQVLIEVALPGVPADRMELVLAPGELVIRGERALPNRPAGTALQRLEIPYGRFERRLALGPGLWELVDRRLADGCLQLLLARR
jgi:HSP20 family molecular chaperone IbpA